MYDYSATVGRFVEESSHLEAGITYGILSDYLTAPAQDFIPSVSETSVYPPSDDLFFEGVEEGRNYQRFDYTGEELYIWAHEYEKENF